MKVYTPRRLYHLGAYTSTTYRDYWDDQYVHIGVPFSGDLSKAPSYFRDTNGRKENDVTHAKLVSDTEKLVLLGPCTYQGIPVRWSSIISERASGGISVSGHVAFARPEIGVVGYCRITTNWGYAGKYISGITMYWAHESDEVWEGGTYNKYPRLPYRQARTYIDRVGNENKYVPHVFDDPILTQLSSALCAITQNHTAPYDGTYKPNNWVKILKEAWSQLMGLTQAFILNIEHFEDYSIVSKLKSRVDLVPGAISMLDSSVFLLDEPEVLFDKLDPVLLGKDTDFSGYWRNWLIQHAFLDACEHIPKLNDNSISNVLEIVGFIYNLVIKHRIEIPKSLSSAWLAYRYSFTTSSLDAREAIDFVHRHMDLGSLDKGISCYGVSYHDYKDTLVTCRCGLSVKPRELGYLGKIWRALYTYGLQPNFYVIWDMIPYSFIVDWFIPLGDVLSVVDASRMYNSDNYIFEKIIYSIGYIRKTDDGNISCYTRWAGSSPPELNGLYWFDKEGQTSTKTHAYRVLDALSITIGH
jgi:hypothetical protein